MNAQVHGLHQKLERLASQHAALVVCNAQQQEAWEAQAGGDMKELRDAMGQLGSQLTPTQRQVMQLTTQVALLQGQLSSQRALNAMQQAILALTVLALGTNWAPTALWALAAAAIGGLFAALLSWSAEARREKRLAAELAAQQQALRLAALKTAGASEAGIAKAREAGASYQVVATASASEKSDDAPPPMSAATHALQARTVFGNKDIDDAVGCEGRVLGVGGSAVVRFDIAAAAFVSFSLTLQPARPHRPPTPKPQHSRPPPLTTSTTGPTAASSCAPTPATATLPSPASSATPPPSTWPTPPRSTTPGKLPSAAGRL